MPEQRTTGRVVHIGGRVLTPMMSAYVDDRATRLWIAGHSHEHCVVSRPGGHRPITLAMSTADNRNP